MGKSIAVSAAICALFLAAGAGRAKLTEVAVASVPSRSPTAQFSAIAAPTSASRARSRASSIPPTRATALSSISTRRRATRRGRVEYEADFYILRPVDAARGSHKIFYDVTNRGRQVRCTGCSAIAHTVRNDPRALEDAGNALILRRGYTIVWSGWDPDAPRANGGLGDEAGDRDRRRQAYRARDPRRTSIRHARSRGARHFASQHEAASQDQSQAKLTVRRGERRSAPEIPGGGLGLRQFARDPAAAAGHEARARARSTNFTIPRQTPACSASGWPRRAISFRFCATKRRTPKATPIPRGPASGTRSRSACRKAGATCAITSRKVSIRTSPRARFSTACSRTRPASAACFSTTEFGQPGRTGTQHEDHTFPENAFPFSTARMTDPVTGQTAAPVAQRRLRSAVDGNQHVHRILAERRVAAGTDPLGTRTSTCRPTRAAI